VRGAAAGETSFETPPTHFRQASYVTLRADYTVLPAVTCRMAKIAVFGGVQESV
jgi:hypothetical protein